MLHRLKLFLEQARYVVLIDDAGEAGLQEALQHLPLSKLRCALLVTSQMLEERDVQMLASAAEFIAVGHKSRVSVCELQPFTVEECFELLDLICPLPSFAHLHRHVVELRAVFEELHCHLPVAIRLFCVWLKATYEQEVRALISGMSILEFRNSEFMHSKFPYIERLAECWNFNKEFRKSEF